MKRVEYVVQYNNYNTWENYRIEKSLSMAKRWEKSIDWADKTRILKNEIKSTVIKKARNQ